MGPCAIPDPLPFARSVSITEADAGVTTVDIPVSLTAPKSVPFSLKYTTKDDSAAAGSDYLPQTGVIAFAPGQKSQIVTIPVVGDTLEEPTEKLSVEFTDAQTSALQASSIVTILDNDQAVAGVQPGDGDNAVTERQKEEDLNSADPTKQQREAAAAPSAPSQAQAPAPAPQANAPAEVQAPAAQAQAPAAQGQAQSQSMVQAQVQQQVQVQQQMQTQGTAQLQPGLLVQREKQIQAEVARVTSGGAGSQGLLASALVKSRTPVALPIGMLAGLLALVAGTALTPTSKAQKRNWSPEKARGAWNRGTFDSAPSVRSRRHRRD